MTSIRAIEYKMTKPEREEHRREPRAEYMRIYSQKNRYQETDKSKRFSLL